METLDFFNFIEDVQGCHTQCPNRFLMDIRNVQIMEEKLTRMLSYLGFMQRAYSC